MITILQFHTNIQPKHSTPHASEPGLGKHNAFNAKEKFGGERNCDEKCQRPTMYGWRPNIEVAGQLAGMRGGVITITEP